MFVINDVCKKMRYNPIYTLLNMYLSAKHFLYFRLSVAGKCMPTDAAMGYV